MRCFISVKVDGSLLEKAQDFLRNRVRGSFTDLSQAHFTLCFLSEKSQKEVEELKQKLSQVRFPSFQVELNGTGFFPSASKPRIAWAGVGKGKQELVGLEKVVSDAIRFVEEKPFSPHVTLARIKSLENKSIAGEFVEKFGGSFGVFRVKKFSLMQSRLGERPVHEELLGVDLP